MSIELIAQPFTGQIGAEVSKILRSSETRSFYAAVAWAKASGLRRLGADLVAAADRGVDLRLIVGIDQGGASIEGLRALQQLAPNTYVFHNPKNPQRTFHSKFYLGFNDESSTAIVGSGNLTSGGLYTNYEAATLIRVADRAVATSNHENITEQLIEYFQLLSSDSDSCRRLDDKLIIEMANDSTITLGTEYQRPAPVATTRQSHNNIRIFQPSKMDLYHPPKPTIILENSEDLVDSDSFALTPLKRRNEGKTNFEPHKIKPASSKRRNLRSNQDRNLDNRWTSFYKRLSSHDVSPKQSPGQIIIPKQFALFFGDLDPDLDGTQKETGSRQWSKYFTARLKADERIFDCPHARFIEYEPASNHKRKNTEYRFTFRNKDAFSNLNQGDYLIFSWDQEIVSVDYFDTPPAGSTNEKYAWLTSPKPSLVS